MHLLSYLAAVFPITTALSLPRTALQERSLVPRVGAESEPGEEEKPRPGEVVPVPQPGLEEYRGGDEPIEFGATFSPGELNDVPDFFILGDGIFESGSGERIGTEQTALFDEGSDLRLQVGTGDAQVGAVFDKFLQANPGMKSLRYQPTIRGEQRFSTDSRRRGAMRKIEGQLGQKTGGTGNPAPESEASVGSNVPPGQIIHIAEVMANNPHDPDKGLKVNIDPPPIELGDRPYDEGAEKYKTVDRQFERGEWVPKVYKTGPKEGQSYEVWQPWPEYDERSLGSPTRRSPPWKRQSWMQTINSAEATAGNTNNTENLQAQFQKYINTYDAIQSNITDLIVPFLSSFVQSTNDSMMIDIAWSVYSQLTGSNVFVLGPFMYGMHCLDSLEEQYFKAHNISVNATTFDNATTEYLAYHQLLLDAYTDTLSNATAVVNQTGLLGEMAILTKYLNTNDTSIAPADWFTKSTGSYDDTFFKTFGLTPTHNTTTSSR